MHKLTEAEIEEIYGKSIWDMTAEEIVEYGLVSIWAKLVDESGENE